MVIKRHPMNITRPPPIQACQHNSVNAASAVADLGSDPWTWGFANSAQRFAVRRDGIPELGSDPNSAGHAECAYRPGFGSDSGKSTLKVMPHRQNTSTRRSQRAGGGCETGWSQAITPVAASAYPIRAKGQNDPQTKPECRVAMVRRIGVRAQFGVTSPAALGALGRIGKTPSPGIRPQICYRVAALGNINSIAVSAYPVRDDGQNHHQGKREWPAEPSPLTST